MIITIRLNLEFNVAKLLHFIHTKIFSNRKNRGKTEVKPLKTEKRPPKVPQKEGKRNVMVVQTAKPRLNRRQTEKVKIKPSETETKPLKTPKKRRKRKRRFPPTTPYRRKIKSRKNFSTTTTRRRAWLLLLLLAK